MPYIEDKLSPYTNTTHMTWNLLHVYITGHCQVHKQITWKNVFCFLCTRLGILRCHPGTFLLYYKLLLSRSRRYFFSVFLGRYLLLGWVSSSELTWSELTRKFACSTCIASNKTPQKRPSSPSAAYNLITMSKQIHFHLNGHVVYGINQMQKDSQEKNN